MFLFQAGLLHVTERARAPGGGEVGAGVWERLRENAQERGRTGEGEDCAKMRRNGGGRENGKTAR